MKFLTAILSFWKFALVPPFAALVIWMMQNFTSSLTRYVVPMFEYCITMMIQAGLMYLPEGTTWEQFMYRLWQSVFKVIEYGGNWIYGLSVWVDMPLIINTVATLIMIQIAYMIVRFVLKLVTVGQI